MAIYEESGLRLTLPDDQHFRFQDLAAYQAQSGHQLKEMDFAWVHEGALFLLEIRSYDQLENTLAGTDFVPAKSRPVPFRFQTLVDKITDSLLMLQSAWGGSTWGLSLLNDLPAAARQRLPLKIVVSVELPSTLSVHLPALKDALNARLKGRLAVADVPRVVLVDHARLQTLPQFTPYVSRAT